jgi:Na+/H+ antiporter NhaD/arsenite permease-like protein
MLNTTTIMLYSIGFCLAIAYSASTGGAGSLVGTTPNLLLKGYFDDHYEDGGLNFITYMAYRLLSI